MSCFDKEGAVSCHGDGPKNCFDENFSFLKKAKWQKVANVWKWVVTKLLLQRSQNHNGLATPDY